MLDLKHANLNAFLSAILAGAADKRCRFVGTKFHVQEIDTSRVNNLFPVLPVSFWI
jgi:hypothetical protein